METHYARQHGWDAVCYMWRASQEFQPSPLCFRVTGDEAMRCRALSLFLFLRQPAKRPSGSDSWTSLTSLTHGLQPNHSNEAYRND
eukprot:2761671-Prorocentrum_lima.AAC.1